MAKREISKYFAELGKRGGAAGTGKSKVRGGIAYYKRISKQAAKTRALKRKADGK